jgi:hypothetical protein
VDEGGDTPTKSKSVPKENLEQEDLVYKASENNKRTFGLGKPVSVKR